MFDVNAFVWSLCTYDKEEVWFIGCHINALFKLDIKQGRYKFITEFPDSDIQKMRAHTVCHKYKDSIFCFADNGDSTLVYDLKNGSFTKVRMNNEPHVKMEILGVYEYNERLYAVSGGLKQVIEIDIKSREVTGYYPLPIQGTVKSMETECICVDNCIYCGGVDSNYLYEFNLITKNTVSYEIPQIDGGIYTICCKKPWFWFSGKKKEIYVWNILTREIQIVDEFPEGFGVYMVGGTVNCDFDKAELPVFKASLCIGNKVWFIPWQTNKILYMDKQTGEIEEFPLEDEVENAKSWARPAGLRNKYFIEYVLGDMCIGLYSQKNNCIYEINTVDFSALKRNYILDADSKAAFQNALLQTKECVQAEEREEDFKSFLKLCTQFGKYVRRTEQVGFRIFEKVK